MTDPVSETKEPEDDGVKAQERILGGKDAPRVGYNKDGSAITAKQFAERAASRPICHVFLLPQMIKAARSCGYSLAIHGTLDRDFDLVAFPWTEEATTIEKLVKVLKESCGGLDVADWEDKVQKNPQVKPHGRKAWTIMLGGDYLIDLSVFEPSVPSAPLAGEATGVALSQNSCNCGADVDGKEHFMWCNTRPRAAVPSVGEEQEKENLGDTQGRDN